MRVLHVTQPTVAGVPTVVRQYAKDQSAHGLDVVIAAPNDGHLATWLGCDGIEHRTWLATRSPGASIPAEIRALRRIISEVSPDIVHLHSAKAGLVGRLALRKRLPTVFQPHAWSFEAMQGALAAAAREWERFAVCWTSLLVCVSEDERRRGAQVGVNGRTMVLPNGVDLSGFCPAEPSEQEQARSSLGLKDGPLVVCVGRLTRQKGQDILLEALPALRARVPGVRLVLVGDGPDADALRANAPTDVIFAGERTEVRQWLAVSDVVVIPSRWEAGGSLVALEAMAMGRSVVSTAVAGAPALLAGAGAVVPIEDPYALAAAVVQRLVDSAKAAAEGACGRKRVEEEHDLRLTVPFMRRAYADLLDQRLSVLRS